MQNDLPAEERESVDAALRHVNFLDDEIAEVERLIAQQALTWPEIRRLMRPDPDPLELPPEVREGRAKSVITVCAATIITAGLPSRA